MMDDKKAANAMGGKTARACDGCLRKRARWFCAADDAFLCQACDASVHSANQLASRHERVRLQTASSNGTVVLNSRHENLASSSPAWHQGFTRKARTPRQHHNHKHLLAQKVKDDEKTMNSSTDPVVPEIGSEEGSMEYENEEQMLYRVPVFNPFAEDLCNIMTSEGFLEEAPIGNHHHEEDGNIGIDDYGHEDQTCELENLHGFLPSDMDLAEFAADVESLLGVGLLDHDSCVDVKDLGLVDHKVENDACFGEKMGFVKVKEEELEGVMRGDCDLNPGFEQTLEWNFDCDSPVIGEEEEGDEGEEEKKKIKRLSATVNGDVSRVEEKRNNIFLRLNYEEVITAWASQGSPWTTGSRPELNPDDGWPQYEGVCSENMRFLYGDVGGFGRGNNEEREARVSRYREKRRTRLFSKKIRYEVRKLNAEKRPRMKGRFVKRSSLGNPYSYLNN